MCIHALLCCNINCIASYKLFPSSMDFSDLFAQSVCIYCPTVRKNRLMAQNMYTCLCYRNNIFYSLNKLQPLAALAVEIT